MAFHPCRSQRPPFVIIIWSPRLMVWSLAWRLAICRPSVEMIEKYYASHIKGGLDDGLDAAAINVKRSRSPAKTNPVGTGRRKNDRE